MFDIEVELVDDDVVVRGVTSAGNAALSSMTEEDCVYPDQFLRSIHPSVRVGARSCPSKKFALMSKNPLH